MCVFVMLYHLSSPLMYCTIKRNLLSKIWCCDLLIWWCDSSVFLMEYDAKVEREVSETVTLCFVSTGCKAG